MKTRNSQQRGVAALEFALILPVFMLMMLGAIEYGWYYHIDRSVTAAAEEGARAAATVATNGGCGGGGAGAAKAAGASVAAQRMQLIGYGAPKTTVTVTCLNTLPLADPTWQVNVVTDYPQLTGFLKGLMPASTTPGNTVAKAVAVMRGS
ncbi:MAG: pilus assembly protein [Myxococcales bacterium]|nr:pilus assembly protein [Myxococcales bacterium]